MVQHMKERIESSVTSVSWIPSEAVAGLPRMVFDSGVTHYDAALPDVIEDLAFSANGRYLAAVQQVTAAVETMLDTSGPARA